MALARVKTWSSGEVLTASDLNAEYNNIINNARDLISPLTASLDMNGFEVILDADADTSITADTDDRLDVRLGGVDVFVFDGTTASTVNGLTFTGVITGARPRLSATGSDTNIGLALRPKGTGAGASVIIEDGSGNEVLIGGVATASAVNEVTVTNAATGGAPVISATGGDTNIPLRLTPKGTGDVQFTDGTDATKIVALELSGLTTGNTRTITVPDVSLTLPYKPGTYGSMQVYTGNDTWTKPAGLVRVKVTVVGGGGGGGGTNAATAAGGGGGGGGTSVKTVAAASLGATEAVTVGAAGAAGANTGGTGGTGGTSSFGAHCSGAGGVGGVGSASNNAIVLGGAGGSGSSGDINLTGSSGGPVNSTGGGATAPATSGGGGNSTLGGGSAGVASAAAGNAGGNYGGGGSGAYGATALGGAGAAGIVIVEEFF